MQSETLHFYATNPQHFGSIADPTVSHHEHNRICGDDITVSMIIDDNRITEWMFTGNASMVTMACAGLFGDIVLGVDTDTVLSWGQDDIIRLTDITVTERRKRAQVLPLLATRNAIHIYHGEQVRDDFSDVRGI